MTVVHLDPDAHARTQALLPWYVTGRLEAAEHAEVEAHLATCPRCRAELALERQLHLDLAAGAPTEAPADVERDWAAMQRRIDADARRPRSLKPKVRPSGAVPVALAGWGWVLGAQFAAILLLSALLLAPAHDAAPYRGLGAPGVESNAVVTFRPDATEAQMRAALREAGARLVGGPTATHAYLLLLPVADDAALAHLRVQPGVTLAEALQGGDAP